MLLSEGQMSDYKGAALMIDAFPKAKALLADRGCDADWRHAHVSDQHLYFPLSHQSTEIRV